MNGLRIRPYRPDDERAVIRLWMECGLIAPHNNPQKDIERKLKIDAGGSGNAVTASAGTIVFKTEERG